MMIDLILRQSLILTYIGLGVTMVGAVVFFVTLGVWMWLGGK